jgi:hypothetical protein
MIFVCTFSWPLYFLSLFELRFLITHLVYSSFWGELRRSVKLSSAHHWVSVVLFLFQTRWWAIFVSNRSSMCTSRFVKFVAIFSITTVCLSEDFCFWVVYDNVVFFKRLFKLPSLNYAVQLFLLEKGNKDLETFWAISYISLWNNQAQVSDQYLATTKLATNKAICLKTKILIRVKCTFKDF